MKQIIDTIKGDVFSFIVNDNEVKEEFNKMVKDVLICIAHSPKVEVKQFYMRENYLVVQYEINGKKHVITVSVVA